MNEDERYRTTTQYKLWSYTPESLAQLRAATNHVAAEKVKAAIQRVRTSKASANTNSESTETDDLPDVSKIDISDVQCLTVEEELKLVAFYCRQLMQMGDHMQCPTDVKATALQYLKRFYLTNSLMTYHAPDILKTALFFATKTENYYIPLSRFVSQIGKTTPEDIRASEFLLTQGLRFTFDVRHPFRALEGAVMELQAIADGAEDLNGHIIEVPGELRTSETGQVGFENRVKGAHGRAREYLKSSALLTDVYFHYTPSQIMLASLFIADQDLTTFYVGTKFRSPDDAAVKEKLLLVLEKCAKSLREVGPDLQPGEGEMRELKALAKKLSRCRNPEKMDLVALSRAAKRDGVGEGEVDERVVKKRRLEREKVEKEASDLFGGELKKPQ